MCCPHRCHLAPGQVGRCHARNNKNGQVVPENYGRITSLALDPVEKKPLARWRAGKLVVSVGSYGCNLSCPFCQNASISQASTLNSFWKMIEPEELVGIARAERAKDSRVTGIAFTYNEPLVSWEYVRDCAEIAHKHNLATVLVSNGHATSTVIDALDGLLDAVNIDLKSFSPEFYINCGGTSDSLACVKATIEHFANNPACHLEVTTLVIPDMNDSVEEIDAIAQWLASLDNGRGKQTIVYHVSRFFPHWHMSGSAPTPVSTVYHLANVAHRHLNYIYTGNC